jgi:release factor glutamine methyltransferase
LPPLRSLSLLAAQTDFSEPGELGLFIDEGQIDWLDHTTRGQGYLSGKQMAGSFEFLHSRDLVWARRMREYLLGEREFYSRMFRITPDVLIPRPETELLVELALAHAPQSGTVRALDLGTGSGIVALTLALEQPAWQVDAVDCSPAALTVASDNAQRLGAANVRLRHSDWYGSLASDERFHLIVSNPPYIHASDPHLAQGDLRFEPAGALTDHADGLSCIRAIIDGARRHLLPQGWLLFEHGYDQAAECRRLLAQAGFGPVESVSDLAGIERVTLGRLPAG